MLTARLPFVFTFLAFVACGGATAIVPDEESGGPSGNGGSAGAGGKPTGAVTGAGGKPTGGITGAGGGKSTGGVTGAGGNSTGGASSCIRWAKGHDQSCKFDEDCVGVVEGTACASNPCFNASINQGAYASWASLPRNCGPIACDPIGCLETVPVCYGGTCSVRKVDYIDPGQFDRTCSVQSDCYVVAVGDLCAGCNCVFDAVSGKGLEQYKARLGSGPTCGSSGIACDCAVPKALCILDGSSTQCVDVY